MQIAPFINGYKLIYSAKTNLLITSWLNVSCGASQRTPQQLRVHGQSQGNFQTMTAANIK